ncbi:MAG: hypothetical protein AAGA54_21110 [Myxococcota bacterium]
MVSLADIPFAQAQPRTLLGLTDAQRAEPDEDFTGFGWCRPASVWLEASTSGMHRIVEPLLVAAHTPDEPRPGLLTLEFWFEHDGEPIAVEVSWARFADAFISPLLGEERDVVLAICNPLDVTFTPPAGFGARRLHVASGDVTSWLSGADTPRERLGLRATRWNTLHAD